MVMLLWLKRVALTIIILTLFFSVAAGTQTVHAEDSWESKSSLYVARCLLGVAVVDGKIYAIGGASGKAQHFRRRQKRKEQPKITAYD